MQRMLSLNLGRNIDYEAIHSRDFVLWILNWNVIILTNLLSGRKMT